MKNVLVFAMPSLPMTMGDRLLEPVDYTMGKTVVNGCISQAEPCARYIQENMAGETELIMICPPETEREVVNFGTSVEPMEILSPISAVGYFILRLVRNGLIDSLDRYIVYEEDETLAKFSLGRKKTVTFLLVRSQDQTEMADIVVKEMKALGKDINLYISLIKGSRRFSLWMSNVLKLLKNDGIDVAKIYGVDRRNRTITNESDLFELNDYVDATNDFVRYGDADGLLSFYPKDEKLMRPFQLISRGLRQANVNVYRDGLEQLRKLFRNKPTSDAMFSPEFSLLREAIESDYGKLLTDERFRYVDAAMHCCQKNQLFQALSFIEAKFTDDLFYSGVIYYEPDEEVIIRKYDARKKKYVSIEGDANDYITYVTGISQKSHVKDQVQFVLWNHCNVYGYRKPKNSKQNDDPKSKVDALYDKIGAFSKLLDMCRNNKSTLEDVVKQARKTSVIGKEEFMAVSYGKEGKVRTKAVPSLKYRYKAHQNGEHIAIDDGITLITVLPDKGNGRKYRILASAVLCFYSVLKDLRGVYARGDSYELPEEEKVRALIGVFHEMSSALLDYAEKLNRNLQGNGNAY